MPREKKKARITFRCRPSLLKTIKERAARERKTMSQIIEYNLMGTLMTLDLVAELLDRLPKDFGCRTKTTS